MRNLNWRIFLLWLRLLLSHFEVFGSFLSNKGLLIKLFNLFNSVGMKYSGESFDNGDMLGRNPQTIVI